MKSYFYVKRHIFERGASSGTFETIITQPLSDFGVIFDHTRTLSLKDLVYHLVAWFFAANCATAGVKIVARNFFFITNKHLPDNFLSWTISRSSEKVVFSVVSHFSQNHKIFIYVLFRFNRHCFDFGAAPPALQSWSLVSVLVVNMF